MRRFIKYSCFFILTNFKKRICEIKIDSKLIGDELRNEEVASKASELAKNPKIRKEIKNVELHLAGKNMPNWFSGEKYEGIVNHKEVENAIEFMNNMDIMLVPLFSAGGIRVKIIEGMALSKPIISTSIGAEGIEHNENIKIANNEDEFIIHAKSLVNDFEKAKKLGLLARIHVSNLYDNEKIVDNLVKFCKHSI